MNQNLILAEKSILLNWKTWLAIFIVILILCKNNIQSGIFTILIGLLAVYFSHVCGHLYIFYPFTITHLYHHAHSHIYSHLIEILFEFFVFLCIPVSAAAIELMGFDIHNVFSVPAFIFVYLLYTTVHNINYSIFHVNGVHEFHHKSYTYNFGPDICDIVFGTKSGESDSIGDGDSNIENTDHYLPNIFICGLATYLLQWLDWRPAFIGLYILTAVLFGLCTLYLFYKHMYEYERDHYNYLFRRKKM